MIGFLHFYLHSPPTLIIIAHLLYIGLAVTSLPNAVLN